MDREKYNACMRPHITGQKTMEQRRLDFCIGAKLCSGKAKTKEEAQTICLQPKPPKPETARRPARRGRATQDVDCGTVMLKVAQCAIRKVGPNPNMDALVNALIECHCK